MHELLSNEKTMFYLPGIMKRRIEDSEESLQVSISEAKSINRSKYFFAILDRKTNGYIGEIGFTKKQESTSGNVMDLGYFIKEEYWGKGIATEASKAVINYAFNNLNTIKIVAGCIVDNNGSERVMQKLRMIKETEFKNHVLLDNRLYDRVEYRLLKEEWGEGKL